MAHKWRYNKCKPYWPRWFFDPFILVNFRYDDEECHDWDCYPNPVYIVLGGISLLGFTIFHVGYENYGHFANMDITVLNFTFYFDTNG